MTPGTTSIDLKSFSWFAYYASEREMRLAVGDNPFGRDLHRVRDGLAFAELAGLLTGEGLQYKTTLLNLPSLGFRRRKTVAEEQPRLGPEDLILLVTRPPLDDPEPPPRVSPADRKRAKVKPAVKKGEKESRLRSILRSGTELERDVLAALRQVFEHCSREKVEISHSLIDAIPAQYMDIEFKTRGGSGYSERWRKTQWLVPAGHTAGYLVFVPTAWVGGPALLTAFGMAGIETLVWARHLRTKHLAEVRQVLQSRDEMWLLIGEWNLEPPPPPRPTSLDFSDGLVSQIRCRARARIHAHGRWSPVAASTLVQTRGGGP